MTADKTPKSTVRFGSQTWNYQSLLVLPLSAEESARADTAFTVKKWAPGKLSLVDTPEGSGAKGTLSFAPRVELEIALSCLPGVDGAPATLKGSGIGLEGLTKGAVYHLSGWAFQAQDGTVECVRGSLQVIRGSAAEAQPIGTVGTFVIAKAEK